MQAPLIQLTRGEARKGRLTWMNDIVRAQRPTRWYSAAGDVSRAPPLICDASAGSRLRHPHDSGAPRPPRREHDDDLHARCQSRRAWCAEPARPVWARPRTPVRRISRETGKSVSSLSRSAYFLGVLPRFRRKRLSAKALLRKQSLSVRRAILRRPLAYWVIEIGRLLVRLTRCDWVFSHAVRIP